ncbi:ATP-binding protein [Streptomyces sp. NPDC127084]|uniref:ATP-binding protein n=1 Tax=Streptomyces sp. NPDC127084 TaxID=3347133 RepID=UPI00366676CF
MNPTSERSPSGPDLRLDHGFGADNFAACGLDGHPRNARQARRFVDVTLRGWGLVALVPDMAVVAGELVTNAVRHALEPGHAASDAYPLWLGLYRQPGHVVCTLTDPSPAPPRPQTGLRSPAPWAAGGRGLALVDALSDSWSWSLTPPLGKAVWASVALPGRPD